jgi:flavin-dependent dehydrogenase
MRRMDVIIVGGGPAGSAAAAALRAGGASVLLLDKAAFPRPKPCAGWITPEVLATLELRANAYPHGLLDLRRLHWHWRGLQLPIRCVQHSIRRLEFDAWLLRRSGVEVIRHQVRQVSREGGRFTIDGTYRCEYLIGAAGTACPVHRALFQELSPRDPALQTVTLELEFPWDWSDPDCHLWFFERGLPGYSWYVPKAQGWLNVGIGAMALRLKERGRGMREYWREFCAGLERRFGVRVPAEPAGYSYYLRDAATVRVSGNAYLIGDSAGLATRDLCEGIGPAIDSGRQAARAILGGGGGAAPAPTASTSLGGGLLSRLMDRAFTGGAGRGRVD